MTQDYTHIALEAAQKAVAALPDMTHADGSPERVEAAQTERAKVERILGRMTLTQLQGVFAKAKTVAKMLGGEVRTAIAV